MAKVAVRFIKTSGIYNSGEIAGFDEKQAAAYIAAGIAIAYTEGAILPPEDGPEPPPESDVPPVGDSDQEPRVDISTHELTVTEVSELALVTEDPEDVAALIRGEQAHPDYPGGRKGAIEALEARHVELLNSPPEDGRG